jgi:hypothetical protein
LNAYATPERVEALVVLLCALALASPLVESVGGNGAYPFWLARAAGVTLALAAVWNPRLRVAALAGVAVFLVVAPATFQMWMRAWSGPASFCHDSVIQFEEAARMLREGRNPYAADFLGTPLDGWRGFRDNPALHHFVYPPLALLAYLPLEALGLRDPRFLILACFAGLVALLLRELRDHPRRAGFVAVAALNPFLAAFVVEGRNDAVMLLPAAAAVAAYARGRTSAGHLLLGVGIACKTLLLPLAPFVVLLHRKDAVRATALLLAPLALTSAPFLAWDARAFVGDVLLAPAGWGEHPFDIRGVGGFGFANLLLALRVVDSPKAAFPFGIFQLAALVFCLRTAWRSLKEDPRTANALRWGTLATFLLLFFGRFIHDNYIGVVLSLAALAAWLSEKEPPAAYNQ